MLVLHCLWTPARAVAIWAEDSTGSAVPERRPGRPARIRVHPFAADEGALRAVLPGPVRRRAGWRELVLLLPTTAGPLPSPEISLESLLPDEDAGEASNGQGGQALVRAAWRLPAVHVDADDVVAVVAALSDPQGAAARAGAVLGASARHLVAVVDFAADLVTRGRLLPAVRRVEGEGAWQALWLPVLTGADVGWARSLLLALPASAHAGSDEARARSVVVAEQLDTFVDAIARHRLGRIRMAGAGGAPPFGAASGSIGAPGRATVTAWLRALTGRRRVVVAPDGELEALAVELARWQAEAIAGTVRGCFRLVEPPAAEGPHTELGSGPDADSPMDSRGAGEPLWRLEFALQATDSPSLTVAADRVWRARGRLRALGQTIEAPQETLLGQLARATRLYPALESALRTARPEALDLDLDGAHTFLTEGAPALAAAGFGVLLPGWWTNPERRLGVRLRSATPSAPGRVEVDSGFGLETLADFRWQLALGEETLSERELAELADARHGLVRLRGEWVSVDADRLAAGLALLGSGREERMSLGEVLRQVGAQDGGPGGLPVLGVDDQGWLGDLLSGATEHRLEPVPPATGFTGVLRPYQGRGLAWLTFLGRLGLGGVLADDMGLGKTVQLLALAAADPPGTDPTLLVCPMSLVGNWQREAARFCPQLRVHVQHGAERARGAAFEKAVSESDLVITTYALAARDATALARIGWHRIVLDEAQAIKNAATRAATAIRGLPAAQRIAVTGTPVENRLADLWSIMEFANPGLLGTAASFKQRFAVPVEKHGDPDAARRLRQLTQPFVLRRMKTDRTIITDLPQKLEMEVVCTLSREQAGLYQAVVDDMLARIEQAERAGDSMARRGLVLATMTRLKQVCNHPAQLLRDGSPVSAARSGKLQRLEEILDEVLASGEKALLFTQYAEFGAMLRAQLTSRFGREVAFLHGGVAKAARDDMVARFQDGGPASPSLFVLSLKAGGTGLTLTAANHVVHVDRWWNPAVEDQATDRAFRIGQRRAVQVRAFVCAGTVEERVAEMIRSKRGLAASIVGTGEQWLSELSTSALRDLIRLDRSAVVD